MNHWRVVTRGAVYWRKLAAGVAAAAYMGLALVPAAQASDTEVYAGARPVSANESPTLMLQLDSGRTVTADGGARFQQFITAMTELLIGDDPLPGFLRLGYSRYQVNANDGGWVRYPPRRLDAIVGLNVDPLTVSVAASSDDVEFLEGVAIPGNAELEVAREIGVRFANVLLPRNAQVLSARVEYLPTNSVAVSGSSTAHSWRIELQDTGNAATFSIAEPLGSRSWTSSSVVASTDAWTAGSTHSVDVTRQLRDLAMRGDWCGGNALALNMRSDITGGRAVAWDTSPERGPRLVVEFAMSDQAALRNTCLRTRSNLVVDLTNKYADLQRGTSPSAATLAIDSGESALRFLPGIFRNATIHNATLKLTAEIDNSDRTVYGVPSVDASLYDTSVLPAFCTTDTDCVFPTASVTAAARWNPRVVRIRGKDVTALGDNESIQFGVTAQLQALVNRADWTNLSAVGVRLNPVTVSNVSAKAHAFGDLSPSAVLSVDVTQQFTDLSSLRRVRHEIMDELRAMVPSSGGTPLGDAYQETLRYLMGTNVSHRNTGADSRVLTAATRTLTSGTDRQFQTPIDPTNQCAAHGVLVMASGELPNMSNVSQHTAGLITNTTEVPVCDTAPYGSHFSGQAYAVNGVVDPSFVTPNGERTGWACMFSSARWGTELTYNQRRALVTTSTVLFENNDVSPGVFKNLQMLANEGEGSAYMASDAAALVEAIKKAAEELLTRSGTITAPGVAVNQLNRLNNLDQLYYALFEPTTGIRWNGNVKRYRLNLTENGSTPGSDVGLYDLNDRPAIDAQGFFDAEARSWWLPPEDAADGNVVSRGGAVRHQPAPASRKLYASVNGSMRLIADSNNALDSAVVAKVANLNGISAEQAINLLRWYQGYDIPPVLPDNELPATVVSPLVPQAEARIGGLLHSRPILVNYGIAAGSTVEQALQDPDRQLNTIYFSTLDGTLHGIDARTGAEELAFIPEEKLARLNVLYKNRTRSAPDDLNPEFGMDLTWSVYRKETAGNLEKVYLYGGMRMGGSTYIALDITDKSSPRVLFTIDRTTNGFGDMGQTWSQPVVTSIRVNGVVKPVLVFGGGYDAARYEVGGPTYPATGLGNRIYIVDAENGNLIHSITHADMNDSIPAQPKVLDVNGDGLADSIYAGDLGGKIFRVDINNGTSTSSIVRTKLFATLDTVTTDRRFYEPPTVALFADANNRLFAAVGLGSGNRSHPLVEDTDDRFYVLFDRDVTRADFLTASDGALQTTLTNDSLTDAAGTIDATRSGWYLDMTGVGEKIITSAVFLRGQLVFVSYSPDQSVGSDCSPVPGRSFLYRADIKEGFPSGRIQREASVLGLGADPQIVILESASQDGSSDIGIVTGTDATLEAAGISAGLQRTRWYEKSKRQ